MTAAKDGVLIRRRLRIFAAAVALVLLCAVCVGGVSGAEFTASTEEQLRTAVANANDETKYPGHDTIIITRDISLSNTASITITSSITIVNADNKDITITAPDVSTIRSMFVVDGGSLVLNSGNAGSLTINGGGHMISSPGGGAVYVTNDGSLVMNNERVTITNFGWLGGIGNLVGWDEIVYNGAGIYVDNGSFTMNGGIISDCNANLGGAVYVSSVGSCTINDGSIESCGHDWTVYIPFVGWVTHKSEAGAIYVADNGTYVQKKSDSAIFSDNKGDPANVRYDDAVITVTYTVEHYLQTLDLESYTLAATEEVEGTVGHSTAADVGDFPGFTAQSFSQETVTEDTVVTIRYNRDTTTITWLVDGAVYYTFSGLYESPVSSPSSNPTKTGYQFAGWNPAIPSTMPAEDLIIVALWEQGVTFVIIIPDSLELAETNGKYAGEMIITAKEFWFPTTDYLELSVSSQNEFHLALPDYPEIKLPYTLTVAGSSEPLVNDGKVATFTMTEYQEQGSSELSVTLNGEMTATPQYSGDYADSLTFTVTYVGDGITA